MFGNTCVEFVFSQFILTLGKPEVRLGYDQVLVSEHVTDAAVTLAQQKIRQCFHFESDPATVTSALVCGHFLTPIS